MAFAGMEKNVDWCFDLHDSIEIQCNKANLKRAFFNIFCNALQALSAEANIRVTALTQASAIQIQIADSGCGMNAL